MQNKTRNFLFGIVWFTLAAFSCTDEDATIATLRASGFTHITTTGYEFFSCGENKGGTCTGFVATGPTGVRVHGAVSCGFWSCGKACTVRIDAS